MGACYLSMEMTAGNEKFKMVLTHTMEPGVL